MEICDLFGSQKSHIILVPFLQAVRHVPTMTYSLRPVLSIKIVSTNNRHVIVNHWMAFLCFVTYFV